jgi:photosystem II stability/assembly factor-like uncharacterized protein
MLRKILTPTILLLLATNTLAAPPTKFTPRGIGGGGAMYSPTINPLNPNELSIACDMSPQFTSTDAGKSWSLIDFRQLQGGRESAIRFTKDPNIRWSIRYITRNGNDQALPARTTDAGKTWHFPPENIWPAARKTYVLYADFENPDRAILTADYTDLYLTTDAGKSFKKLTSPDKNTGLHLAGAFFDNQTIHVALSNTILTSADGGKTFAPQPATGLPPKTFISSYAAGKSNGKTRFAAVVLNEGFAGITGEQFKEYKAVYILDPDKKEWAKKTEGITASPFFVKMATNDPDTIYVAGGTSHGAPAVFKSTNGGDTWTDIFQTRGNKNITIGWAGTNSSFAWSFPEYALGFDVSPLDKNHLILTDLGCAHLSTDAGKSWRQCYTTPVIPPGDIRPPNIFTSNGLEVTSVWQIHWFNDSTLVACATDIRGFRSIDAGKSWSFNYTGHTFNTMYSAATDPQTKITYAAVSSVHDLYQSTYLQDKKIDNGKGAVLSTADNGATWKPVGNITKPVVQVTAHPRNTNHVYAAVVHSKDGGIYHTTNADQAKAATWTKLTNPPRTQGHPHNIHILNDNSLLVTYSGRRDPSKFTPSSGVFLSTDNGKTWEDRTDPRMNFWTKDIALDPADKSQNTWYAGVFHAWGQGVGNAESGLYRTTDRGKSWTKIAGDNLAPSGILNVESVAFDPQHPGQFYMTTEYDGLFFCENIRAKTPEFKSVEAYKFKHPLRVQFNPTRPTEIWITSFGNAIQTGETTP